jgi:5-formyltetrahydrofolate cyclo-ligase
VDAEASVLGRKASLRASAAAARRALSTSERAAASERVVTRLLRVPEIRLARTALLYAALAEEVDVGGLVGPLRAGGATTCFPRVHGDELRAVAAADLRTLAIGYRGIREPDGPAVPLEDIEVVVVPGTAFDRSGGRLGHGGGHYDRLLERLPPACLRVGVCFACQVVLAVPTVPHDQPVDVVVTERTTHRTGARPTA